MVARHFGWKDRIDDHIIPIAVMSIYCWLRHPDDIQRATLAAVSLGGQTHLLGAIVGGLVGAHVGISRLPEELTSKLNGFPHGPSWIEKMAHRLSRWPHGEHDLHTAPALASRPVFQLLRNLSLRCILLGHRLKNRCAVAQTSDSSGTSSSANSSEQTQCLGMN
jgi:hypothetical protein